MAQTSCPPLDLNGGAGPFLSADGDSCGDLFSQEATGCDENADSLWADSAIDFSVPVTFPCRDAAVANDGVVNIPACTTWGNQSAEVGASTYDSAMEVIPGTKAKCRCEDRNTTIPLPNLSLTCARVPT